MSKPRVWLVDGYTEAHRTLDRVTDLCEALSAEGTMEWCVGHNPPEGTVDAVVCGSIFKADHTRRHAPTGVPVVHYNWDLYPHVVQTRRDEGWGAYLDDLRSCRLVLVPGVGTQVRTRQMCGRDAVVVRPPVKVWEPFLFTKNHLDLTRDPLPQPRSYVLDVMRDYPWDPGHTYPEQACAKLGVPLVRTKTGESWDRFRWLVANAACLVSAVEEASTGGLTLLEGYAHGVPVVVSDSGWNEAGRYFGDRAYMFEAVRHVAVDSLYHAIDASFRHLNEHQRYKGECREWVGSNFSDAQFAKGLAEGVRSCLT